MRRFGLFAALLMLAGVLAACTITVTYSAPPNPDPATANTDNTTPVAPNVTVPGNSTVYFDVALPSSVRAHPLLYVELDSNLNLSLISYSTYHTLASSHSSGFFASGTVGLTSLSAAGGLAPQAVGVNYNCHGSCVIWPMSGESHVYVGIENTGSSSTTVDLYAYGYDYQDSYESGNDVRSGAVPLYSGSPDSGAIETLGDVDWWHISSTGNLTFTKVSSAISLEAELYASNGDYINTYSPSNSATISVLAGDYLMVQSVNGYAGSSGVSRYDLSY